MFYLCVGFVYNTAMKQLIFVLDPMCSWCWGFAPVLRELEIRYGHTFSISYLFGGLRNKGDQPWNDDFKAYLKQHWESVAVQTGQPFNSDFFQRRTFDYDTEPASRAMVCMRHLHPEKMLKYLHHLQQAFYQDTQDITQERVLVKLSESFGVDVEAFEALMHSEAIKEETIADRFKARSMGANVFPSVVMIDAEGHLCVLKGYRTYEELERLLV